MKQEEYDNLITKLKENKISSMAWDLYNISRGMSFGDVFTNNNDLFDAVKNSTSLTYLELKFSANLSREVEDEIDSKQFESHHRELHQKLADILKSNTSLTTLVLRWDQNVQHENIEIFADALKSNKNIVKLDLSCSCINAEKIKLLLEGLKENKGIKSLNLEANEINDEGLNYLAQVLEKNADIMELNLFNSEISGKNAEKFLQTLKSNQNIKKLNLSYNANIDEEGMKNFMEALGENTGIIELDITTNNVNGKKAEYFAQMLEKNKSITKINLSNNKMNDKDLNHILRALEKHPDITTLNLSNNKITDKGMKDLAETLKKYPTITTLNLSGNKISDKGIKDLSEVLKKHPTITTLNLSNNKISDKGIKYLGQMLEENKNIKSLNLMANDMTSEGVKIISKVLLTNNTIEKIDLPPSLRIDVKTRQEIKSSLDENKLQNESKNTAEYKQAKKLSNERFSKIEDKDFQDLINEIDNIFKKEFVNKKSLQVITSDKFTDHVINHECMKKIIVNCECNSDEHEKIKQEVKELYSKLSEINKKKTGIAAVVEAISNFFDRIVSCISGSKNKDELKRESTVKAIEEIKPKIRTIIVASEYQKINIEKKDEEVNKSSDRSLPPRPSSSQQNFPIR